MAGLKDKRGFIDKERLDLTERKALEDRLFTAELTDPLTRLTNRVADIPAPAHDVGHQPTDSEAVRRVALAAFEPASRFDIGGDNTTTVALNGTLQPAAVTVYSPKNYIFDGSAGSLAGAMTLMKAGSSSLTLSGSHSFSGKSTVWDGAFVMNGSLTQSPLTVWGGTWGGTLAAGLKGGRVAGTGTFSQLVTLGYRGGVTPGSGMGNAGTLNFAGGLTAQDGSYFAMDLSNDPSGAGTPNDKVAITGNLSLSGKVGLVVKPLGATLAPGTYTLITYTGTLTGNVSNLAVTVPAGTPYTLAAGSGAVTLTVPVTRAPAAIVWRGSGGAWDLAASQNWLKAGAPDVFVSGDTVTFDATGSASATATLSAAMPVAGVTVNSTTNYTFTRYSTTHNASADHSTACTNRPRWPSY